MGCFVLTFLSLCVRVGERARVRVCISVCVCLVFVHVYVNMVIYAGVEGWLYVRCPCRP